MAVDHEHPRGKGGGACSLDHLGNASLCLLHQSRMSEYAKWPKMGYSARIMPQLYFLLLRPYHARNFADRTKKGPLAKLAFFRYNGKKVKSAYEPNGPLVRTLSRFL